MAWSKAATIQAGDTVIFWLKRDVLEPVVITPGKEYHNRFGAFRHSDLIGVQYGSRVNSRNDHGFIHVLRPTPELWTLALPHRTQILYMADIAFITSYLNIRPGSRVLEAGTGSGSFSHSVLRTIGSTGHLFSFEFHQGRAEAAELEFKAHGFSENATLTHRNVCKDGFGGIEDTIDCVFLDLPAPWLAIPHVVPTLRKSSISRICCYSPCMEQVMKTVTTLNEQGFTRIEMYESLIRPHDVSAAPKPLHISEVTKRLTEAECRKEERRLRQMQEAQRRNASKRKIGEVDGSPATTNGAVDQGEGSSKRPKVSEISETPDEAALSSALPMTDSEPSAGTKNATPENLQTSVVSRVIPEVRGHTSYLTFALYLPYPPPPIAQPEENVTPP